MRKLQYRAWDGISIHLIIDGFVCCGTDGEIDIVHINDIAHAICDPDDKSQAVKYRACALVDEGTGITDMHNQRIFENDIVKRHTQEHQICCVIWHQDSAAYMMQSADGESLYSLHQVYTSERVEVVGNYHQHKELLEEQSNEDE